MRRVNRAEMMRKRAPRGDYFLRAAYGSRACVKEPARPFSDSIGSMAERTHLAVALPAALGLFGTDGRRLVGSSDSKIA